MKESTWPARRARVVCVLCWVLLVVPLAGCSSASQSDSRSASQSGSRSASRSGSTAASAVTTVRGADVVVSGDVPQSRLREVSRDARDAVADVRRVWGDSVLAGRVQVEVASDAADFRRRGGNTEAGGQVGATTTADDHVVLAPALFSRVTRQGRVVVLTHELTHVALHQADRADISRWVVEGAAELTAYRPTRLGLARAAPQLARAVRAGRVPIGPPSDARFRSAPEAAYQEAYGWCAFLVDRFGLSTFTHFVRGVDSGRSGAFGAVFGVSRDSLQGEFAAFLRQQIDNGE